LAKSLEEEEKPTVLTTAAGADNDGGVRRAPSVEEEGE
jgi:hypothetical protein